MIGRLLRRLPLVLVLLVVGCDDAVDAPAPSSVASIASIARIASGEPVASSPSPASDLSTSDPNALDPNDGAPAPARPGDPLPANLVHPDGVPFPLPDPLPPEAQPRSFPLEGAALPEPGPAPLEFWVGGTGTADGKLQYPRAISAVPDGSVFVCDKSGRIQRWDHEGRLRAVVRTPTTAQGKPTGIRVDDEGQLLVADTHYCRVLVYGPDLQLRRVWGAPGRAPGLFMFISSVVQGPDGLWWTTDYGDDVARVQAFRPDGTWVRATGRFGTGEGELRRPMSLCFDATAGEVFVADAVNHRIVVLALADGRWLRALGGPGRGPGELDFPYDVARDDEGRLWVAEFGNQRVQVLDPRTGASLGTWGAPGRRLGALARPWGLALGRGSRLWVLDSNNDRVYALDRAQVLGGPGKIPGAHQDG